MQQAVRPGDAQLVHLIAAEVERDGGTALVSRLISYNPAIRKLLSDRRLLPFLQQNKEAFELLRSDGPPTVGMDGANAASGATYRVRTVAGWRPSALQSEQETGTRKRREPEQQEAGKDPTDSSSHQCTGCRATFRSRSALFKHLRGLQGSVSQCSAVAATAEAMAASDGSAAATAQRHTETKESRALEQAVVFALRRRLLRMGRRDAQQQDDTASSQPQAAGAVPSSTYTFDEDYAPLTWLATSKKAKVQRSLINYIRLLPTAAAMTNGQEQEGQPSGQGLEQQGIELLTRTAGLELLSELWWTEATEILRKFLQQESRKKLFDIMMQKHRHLGSCIAAVRLTKHGLESLHADINTPSGDEQWDPVWSRVLALLEGQRSVQGGMAAGQGDHFLGRLASDIGKNRTKLPLQTED
jgi:hypothetical protein